ncbi:MAG: SUMF1/EgtB/PvdO family nonheme iron enzyme [Planctomycetota bacterium]
MKRLAAAAALAPAALVLAACGGVDRDDRPLEELEQLAFVPAARLVLVGYEAYPWAKCSLDRPLVFDRYEFSESRLAHYRDELVDEPIQWRSVNANATANSTPVLDRPAALSLADARAVAAARGMRLPKPHEWLHVALGGRSEGFPFPWGTRSAFSGGNTLELSIGGPTPIGAFEGGRSRRYDCYDLVGNLWEWVDGHVPGYDDDWVAVEAGTRRYSVLGGAFDTRLTSIYGATSRGELVYLARTQDEGYRSPTVGARMCADAEAYLREHAPRWRGARNAPERVGAVGRRWGRGQGRFALERLLELMIARGESVDELGWLLAGVRR